jgi:hypothetical protein
MWLVSDMPSTLIVEDRGPLGLADHLLPRDGGDPHDGRAT